MRSTLFFTWNGTLDADGHDWQDRFKALYRQHAPNRCSSQDLTHALALADDQVTHAPDVVSWDLRHLVHQLVVRQLKILQINDPSLETRLVEGFYLPTERVLHRNRHILEELTYDGIGLSVVAPFFGNLRTLCDAFGYTPLLQTVLELPLKEMNLRPSLEKLNFSGSSVGFVGSAFAHEIVPAKAMGFQTFWLTGDAPRPAPEPNQVDVVLRSLEELPRMMSASSSSRENR